MIKKNPNQKLKVLDKFGTLFKINVYLYYYNSSIIVVKQVRS